MLIDAAGNEVPHDRCRCGRHKVASSDLCCRECPGTLTGRHAVGCHMRQEHFPDTRRGVVLSAAEVERDRPAGSISSGSLPVARVERVQ